MKLRPIQNEYLRQVEHLERIRLGRERLNEMLKQKTDFISPIPDMRDAYRQVRKSNASIPQSVISATTTRTYK